MLLISWNDRRLQPYQGKGSLSSYNTTMARFFFANQVYFCILSLKLLQRVQTSYVTVDPKKKKDHGAPASDDGSVRFHQPQMQSHAPMAHTSPGTSQALDALAAAAQIGRENIEQSLAAAHSSSPQSKQKSTAGALRRARMIITVQRTEAYKKWLEENPVQDIIAGDDE
jgi:hypothetical protein